MDLYGNNLVNTKETKPFCVSSSNLVDMLSMGNPIDLEVKVTMGIIDKCGVRGDATLCVVIFIENSNDNFIEYSTVTFGFDLCAI